MFQYPQGTCDLNELMCWARNWVYRQDVLKSSSFTSSVPSWFLRPPPRNIVFLAWWIIFHWPWYIFRNAVVHIKYLKIKQNGSHVNSQLKGFVQVSILMSHSICLLQLWWPPCTTYPNDHHLLVPTDRFRMISYPVVDPMTRWDGWASSSQWVKPIIFPSTRKVWLVSLVFQSVILTASHSSSLEHGSTGFAVQQGLLLKCLQHELFF